VAAEAPGSDKPQPSLYPLDVDRALDKLETIRDRIVWWQTGAQLQQQLADGEVALSSAWNGRVQKEIDAGTPVEIQWNQNLQTADYLVVPKGTSHKEEAMRLIAYCVSAQNNHRLSEYIEYAPINKESSPSCVELKFCELRLYGVLRSSSWQT
jgi:putative spermidine/putrescine transport system substrate-binding protein